MEANSVGVLNAIRHTPNKAQFLFASSSEVYGKVERIDTPTPESYKGSTSTTGSRACYTESKRFAEALVYNFTKRGQRAVIARIFNTIGVGMPLDGRVTSSFFYNAYHNYTIPVQGHGGQTRTFISVQDMVNGLIRLSNEAHNHFSPVNIGGVEELTIYDLAEKVADLVRPVVGKDIEIQHVIDPFHREETKYRRPFLAEMRSICKGWQPTRKIDDVLAEMNEEAKFNYLDQEKE